MDTVTIFGRLVPTYGLMLVLGFSVGLLLSYFITRKYEILFEDYILGFAYALIFGFLGAKLLYLFVSRKSINWELFFSNFDYFMAYMRGGQVFYGGLLGALLGIYISNLIHRIDAVKILSTVMPTIPIMHAFGRFGCYSVGCCFGLPVDVGAWHVIYTSPAHPLMGTPLLPIQLIEAFLNISLSIGLFIYLNKKGPTRKLIYYYIISYSIIRFVLEFYRYDDMRGIFAGLSTSQYISICLFIIAAYRIFNTDWFRETFKSDQQNAGKYEDSL